MILLTRNIIHGCILSLLFIITSAQANLLVSPTQLSFSDRKRSEKVVIINTGDVTRSYRVSWKQMQALPQGGYTTLSKEEALTFNTASDMFRYSPRQVTLKPGERQVVKLALRRPKGLAEGEYRSHLMLTALPPKNENRDKSSSINLKLLLSYTLPVIVRQGEEQQPKANIKDIHLSFDKERQKTNIDLLFTRHGNFSTRGNINAYFTPTGSEQELHVATRNSYTIYSELDTSFARIIWSNSPFTAGQLRIVYKGVSPYQEVTISEKHYQITDKQLSVVK